MPSAIRPAVLDRVQTNQTTPMGTSDLVLDLLVNYGSSDVHNTRFYLNKEDSDYQTLAALNVGDWVKLILEREVTDEDDHGNPITRRYYRLDSEHDVPEWVQNLYTEAD